MKILLTGSNGQVGYEIVNQNKKFGFELTAFSHKSLDISDYVILEKTIIETKPDLVINAAAYTSVDKAETEKELTFLVNKKGSFNLAKACSKIKIPIFHISTDYVFDGSLDRPYSETDIVSPNCVYGKSKEAGEREIRKNIKNHIILRTSWVFGKKGNNFVKTILKLSKDKKEISVVNDQFGGPTSAISIAKTLLKMADKFNKDKKLKWGTYHHTQSPYVSWYDFANEIFDISKNIGVPIDTRLKPISSNQYPSRIKRPKNSRLDTKKIKKLLGDDSLYNWKLDLNNLLNDHF